MSKESSPAFQWYPKEYLSDIKTQVMTIEEEGCYRRLIDFCWIEGSLPNDVEILASLCKGVAPSNRVVLCFTVLGDTLVHKRLELERVKQEAWREKCAKGGKSSAGKRKHPKDISREQSSTTTAPRVVALKGNTAVCSLQSAIDSTDSQSSSVGTGQRGPAKPKALKRVPEDFTVTVEMREWAAREVPGVNVDRQTKLFRNHEFKRSYTDWKATWENWMMKADSFSENGGRTNAANSGGGQGNRGVFSFEPEYVPRKE